MVRYKSIFIIIFPLLTACVSEQEQLNMDRQKCISYGYKNDPNKLADCIKDIQIQRDKIDDKRYREMQKENHDMVFKNKK